MAAVTVNVPEPQPISVTVELTVEEAKILGRVAGVIGGKPEGPRGHAERVLRAIRMELLEHGVDSYDGSIRVEGGISLSTGYGC